MSEKETGEKKSFEDRLQQVQDLTARIESGAMPLEDSVKEFERGIGILADLETELNDMQRRLTVLRDGKEAEMTDENL
jgi:exodeoxyribonuclease VII small subunit